MASPTRDSPAIEPQGPASPQLNAALGLGLGITINIYCHTVIIERPLPHAEHSNPIRHSPTNTAPNGVWIRSGGIPDFMRTLYWNILDRNPENQLAIDNLTKHTYLHGLAHTVGSLFTTTEYTSKGFSTGATVDKFYLAIMGRQADAETGRSHWIEQIANGMSLWEVAKHFIGHAEYRARVQAGTAPDPIHWP